jgi:predicted ester cyclase
MRMIDAANSDDLETFSKAVDELSEPNAVLHTPAAQGPAYKEVFAALYRAYPDLHIAVEDLMAEGDKVSLATW